MKIRRANISDIPQISFVEESSGYHKKNFNSRPMIEGLFKDKSENVFVLEYKNKVLGYATLRTRNKLGELGLLAITKEAQGKGRGLILINSILSYAKKTGCKRVFLDVNNNNLKAVALYTSLDFRVIGIKNKRFNGKSFIKLRMEKELK